MLKQFEHYVVSDEMLGTLFVQFDRRFWLKNHSGHWCFEIVAVGKLFVNRSCLVRHVVSARMLTMTYPTHL